MPALDNALKTVKAVYPFVDATTAPGTTTLTAAVAAGATVLAVAGIANFANGDDIRVGSGETLELARILGAPAGSAITLAKPLAFAHGVGEAVVEQKACLLGDPEASGFVPSWAAETSDVNLATQRLAYTTLTGYVDLGGTLALPVLTIEAIALALGVPLPNLSGVGTTVSPRALQTNGTLIGAVTNMSLVVLGETQSGAPIRYELWNVSVDYTGFSLQLARGVLAQLPVKVLASGAVIDFSAGAWVPSTVDVTFQPSKGDVFDAITEFGQFGDSGTATTVPGVLAAGATAVAVAAAAGIVVGDWVRIDTGDRREYHMVGNVAVNTLTLRTPLLFDHIAGVACVKATLTPFSGISTDGVTLTVSGNVDTQRIATQRVSIGYRPGNAVVKFAFESIALTPQMFQLALAIPSAAYANSRLPLGDKIGTATLEGVYLKGTTQGGKTVYLNGWSPSLEVNGQSTWSQAAEARLPIAIKPSVLQAVVLP